MKEKLREYIVNNVLEDTLDITHATSLYNSGLVTSMGHLKLINYIERTFEIALPMNEIRIENFDTIEQISIFIDTHGKE